MIKRRHMYIRNAATALLGRDVVVSGGGRLRGGGGAWRLLIELSNNTHAHNQLTV